MAEQQSFELRAWGGKRRGAGRPARREGALPHSARDDFHRDRPVHVTLRFAGHVWNLRSERSYAIVHRALEAARRRPDARVVHFGILGNHVHLIIEAEGPRALANAVRALSIRLARGLNRMMGRAGPVFEDRYHAHVLRTPAEVRNAVRYVLGNYARHAAGWGERRREGFADPFSSAVVKAPRAVQRVLFAEPVTRAAGTWLLRGAEGRAGPGSEGRAAMGEPLPRQTRPTTVFQHLLRSSAHRGGVHEIGSTPGMEAAMIGVREWGAE